MQSAHDLRRSFPDRPSDPNFALSPGFSHKAKIKMAATCLISGRFPGCILPRVIWSERKHLVSQGKTSFQYIKDTFSCEKCSHFITQTSIFRTSCAATDCRSIQGKVSIGHCSPRSKSFKYDTAMVINIYATKFHFCREIRICRQLEGNLHHDRSLDWNYARPVVSSVVSQGYHSDCSVIGPINQFVCDHFTLPVSCESWAKFCERRSILYCTLTENILWSNRSCFWGRLLTQGAHSMCVCNRSKCAGFTVCFTYSNISLSMSINQCQINVELPYLWYIVVLLPQKRFLSDFEGFWVHRLLFLIIEGEGRYPCFERAPALEQFSLRKLNHFAFKLRVNKVKRFTLLLVPSNWKIIHWKILEVALEENWNPTVF